MERLSPNGYPIVEHSQPEIEKALRDARGDLFVAAQMLEWTSVKLDRAIRTSPELQTTFLAIEQTVDSGYEKASREQFETEVSRRVVLYRSDALDSLHDLATMPISDNSAQNQVKLAAAARLTGPHEQQGPQSDFALTLAQLNDEYHRAAPKIKEIRERIITFESDPKVIESVEPTQPT